MICYPFLILIYWVKIVNKTQVPVNEKYKNDPKPPFSIQNNFIYMYLQPGIKIAPTCDDSNTQCRQVDLSNVKYIKLKVEGIKNKLLTQVYLKVNSNQLKKWQGKTLDLILAKYQKYQNDPKYYGILQHMNINDNTGYTTNLTWTNNGKKYIYDLYLVDQN